MKGTIPKNLQPIKTFWLIQGILYPTAHPVNACTYVISKLMSAVQCRENGGGAAKTSLKSGLSYMTKHTKSCCDQIYQKIVCT